MNKKLDLLVGLDIGTTEIRCLIGIRPTEEDKKFHILGLGCAVNEGMRQGVIVNYDEVIGAVESAIRQAETYAGYSVEAVTVNINGVHLRSLPCRAEVAVSNTDRVVTEFDRDLVDRKAKENNIPPNRRIIQFFPNSYRVDQVKDIEDPVGIQGNVVAVKALAVTGLSVHVDVLERICAEVGVRVNNITISSLAVAEATFDKKAMESGVAVIDIGHSTTNLVIIRQGRIEHVAVIPLGGFNVTKDIAIILQVDLEVAEFLKINHADLNYEGRGTKTIDINRQQINFSPKTLSEVASARLKEICDLIGENLEDTGFAQELPGGIVLAGGVSQTKGLTELFQDQLQIHTRVGKLRNFGGLVETIEQKHEYATVAGILALDFILRLAKASRQSLQVRLSSGFRFWHIFRRKVKTRYADSNYKIGQNRESNVDESSSRD